MRSTTDRLFVLALLMITLATGGCTTARPTTFIDTRVALPLTTSAICNIRPIRHPTVLAPSPLNRYTVEGEMALGARMANGSIAPRFSADTLIADAPLQLYLHSLLSELLIVAPDYAKAFTYRVQLYRDPLGRNAYAVPGGYIFVSLEIIAGLDSEGALVGILGHEMGHIALRHSTAQLTFEDMIQKKTTLLGRLTKPLGTLFAPDEYRLFSLFQEIEARDGVVTPEEHRRHNELEADIFSAQVMSLTRFSTEEFKEWHQRLSLEWDGAKSHLETHPLFGVRAKRIDQEISLCAPQPVHLSTPTSFATMRTRAKLLAARRFEPELIILPPPLVPTRLPSKEWLVR